MPYSTHKFINGEKYHVVSKAKSRMQLFWVESDYYKFMRMAERYSAGRVRIIAFGIVKNHCHFLLEQVCGGGISKFINILTGQYSRQKGYPGGLFRSPFWAERIGGDDHYYSVLAYVLRNPGKHKMVNLGRDGRSGLFPG